MPETYSPHNFKLEVATFVNNEGEGYDIIAPNVMLGFKIHESITSNFLMGEVVIADSLGILEHGKLFGQESIRLRFQQPQGFGSEVHDNETIDQVFRIYQIDSINRIGQNTLVYTLRFCSPEFTQARRIRVSQAYRGSMTDIAGQIAQDHLDIDIDPTIGTGDTFPKLVPYFDVREKSAGDNFHVVIPNWTCNYAINWLCEQAQGTDSQSGLQDSFYFYQTANGGYRIQSIESMMNVSYLGGSPFSYSTIEPTNPREIGWDETEGGSGMGKRIVSYRINRSADVMDAIIEGMFASRQITIDNTYKYYHEKTFDYLERFYAGNDMSMNPYPLVRQEEENIYIGHRAGEDGNVPTSLYKTYDRITSYSDAYTTLTSDSHFVHDKKNNINQASHNTHLGSEQYRQAVRKLLNYYSMNLIIPTRTDISAGMLINLEIPIAKPGSEDMTSKFHSGMHLITDIDWVVDSVTQTCVVTLRVIKDSILERIETALGEYPERIA